MSERAINRGTETGRDTESEKSERDRQTETGRDTERVCVCERERESTRNGQTERKIKRSNK